MDISMIVSSHVYLSPGNFCSSFRRASSRAWKLTFQKSLGARTRSRSVSEQTCLALMSHVGRPSTESHSGYIRGYSCHTVFWVPNRSVGEVAMYFQQFADRLVRLVGRLVRRVDWAPAAAGPTPGLSGGCWRSGIFGVGLGRLRGWPTCFRNRGAVAVPARQG